MSSAPPPPPPQDFGGQGFAPPLGQGIATRWSAAAISGFVLSFLGCTGLGALLGLVFAVLGIVNTRGGRRRGKGLAIAAIPISLLTLGVGAFLAVASYAALKMFAVSNEFPAIMGAQADTAGDGAAALLRLMSDEARDSTSPEQVRAWLETVDTTHGKLISIQPDPSVLGGTAPDGRPLLNFIAKFVNGRANVQITFDPQTAWDEPRIADVLVDGVSLQDTTGTATADPD